MSIMHLLHYIIATAADAGWILMGFIAWAITFGTSEVSVSNSDTHRSIRFPIWWK